MSATPVSASNKSTRDPGRGSVAESSRRRCVPRRRLLVRVWRALTAARLALPVLLPALWTPVAPAQDGTTAPSNILIIVADDVGVDMVGAYGVGSDLPPTPNIDRLAAEGLLFRQAWANPYCSPSRATILTGRHAFRSGIGHFLVPQNSSEHGLPLSEVTLPEMLDRGTGKLYRHAALGKWHLGSPGVGGASAPNLAGFDHFAGTLGNLEDYGHWPKTVDGSTSMQGVYPATDKVDDAIAWIDGQSRPWCLYLAFNLAHVPFHVPPDHLHDVDLSGADSPLDDPRPYYKAMVQALDTELGRLLDALEPQADDTLVLFLGDNGTPGVVTQAPFDPDGAKGTLYEGGVHVPLIARGPGIASGGECAALVNTVDLFATAAEVAGVSLGTQFQGLWTDSVSLVPYFTDPGQASRRETALAEIFLPNGPAVGLPPASPAPSGCQEDLGYGGPGAVSLSVCGDALAVGMTADLALGGAPPFAPAWLVAGLEFQPLPVAGGTLTPVPWLHIVPLVTDAQGEVFRPGVTNIFDLPVDIYLQAVVLDPAQPEWFTFSNTVRAALLPPHRKAIRNERYKLHMHFHGGADLFFDLEHDPLEQHDLLGAGPLGPDQLAEYQALRQALLELLASG